MFQMVLERLGYHHFEFFDGRRRDAVSNFDVIGLLCEKSRVSLAYTLDTYVMLVYIDRVYTYTRSYIYIYILVLSQRQRLASYFLPRRSLESRVFIGMRAGLLLAKQPSRTRRLAVSGHPKGVYNTTASTCSLCESLSKR